MTYRGWTVPDVYTTRPSDLDVCACGGPKTKHASMCIACRRRVGKARRSPVERFWARVDTSGDCWLWTGATNASGYGVMFDGPGGERLASRCSWIVANGPIPDGLKVCHTCDNPPCVRPDHLWLGTQADNLRDGREKGRIRPFEGLVR